MASFIQRCLDAGMPMDMVVKAVAAFEAECPLFVHPEPSKEALRARAYRANKPKPDTTRHDASRRVTTERDEESPSPPPSPPAPPTSTTLSEEPTPFTPLKGGVSPALAKPNGFARFWEAYPNKVAKRAAEKAFVSAVKRVAGGDAVGEMIAAIERAKRSRKWREGFIPNPATWLNGDCWEDDPDGERAREGRPPPKPEPAIYAAHVRHYRDTGEWKPSWGKKPDLEAAA